VRLSFSAAEEFGIAADRLDPQVTLRSYTIDLSIYKFISEPTAMTKYPID
jgi:hypothetical protein